MNLTALTIGQAANMLKFRQISPVELVRATLEKIEYLNPILNAYISVLTEQATRAAMEAEKEIVSQGVKSLLHGIPLSVKDLFATKGIRTTAGSKILRDWIPSFDSTVVSRLQSAGAIIVGKAHADEFAIGAVAPNHHFGLAKNPWDEEYYCGGSSTGSGISVSTGMAMGSMGSDTGGSVRLPAALVGVTGLKPTFGLVSRHGVNLVSWTLDHVGPLTRTAEDAAIMLQTIAGHDPLDPFSSRMDLSDYISGLGNGIRGLRIGVLEGFVEEITHEEISWPVNEALDTFKALGATIRKISVPHFEYSGPALVVIAAPEGASLHEEWVRNRAHDYGPLVLRWFHTGLLLRASHYHRAQRLSKLIEKEFMEVMMDVDVIVSPTTPFPPPKIGQKTVSIHGREINIMPLLGGFTQPYNLTGMPAISVCCGFTRTGLPVGLQITGQLFDGATVLRVAHAYQQMTNWHMCRPQVD